MHRFFIRLDASPSIGLGHARRCATLGQALIHRGAEAHYVLRLQDIHFNQLALPAAAIIHQLPWEDSPQHLIDYCAKHHIHSGVIDHYHMEGAYQKQLSQTGLKWMQFGNKNHAQPIYGSVLHDAAPGTVQADYSARVRNPKLQFLLGPEYALLKPEYKQLRQTMSQLVKPQAERILLTFGGGDDRGATCLVLEWLQRLQYPGHVDILTTSLNGRQSQIQSFAHESSLKIRVHLDETHPEKIMTECDLAFTAGGTTLHELACLVKPCLIITIAENQHPAARVWQKKSLGAYLGDLHQQLEMDEPLLREWINEPKLRRVATQNCLSLPLGSGAEMTAEQLCQLL